MALVENDTRFHLASFFQYDTKGQALLVTLVTCTYRMPLPQQPSGAPLLCMDEQPPLPLGDEYFGESGQSSLKMEGQAIYGRPGTDIYLTGQAHAPFGRPVTGMMTKVTVGPCKKAVAVIGDRIWQGHPKNPTPSRPKPFVSMPLCYENSFGGAAKNKKGAPASYESRNPVGRGWYEGPLTAVGQPLPNLEDRDALIKHPGDRPAPVGYGPIYRGWEPRQKLAGTYDQNWIATRAPYWPADLDPLFFSAASPELNSGTPLAGGEPVALEGFSPDGVIHFALPHVSLVLECSFAGNAQETAGFVFDTLALDTDAGSVTLGLRSTVSIQGREAQVTGAVVREVKT